MSQMHHMAVMLLSVRGIGPRTTAVSDAPLIMSTPLPRLEVVTQSTAALRKALGPHCGAVGLGTLGTTAVQPTWTDAEEALLEEGMRAWGRDFRQVQHAPSPEVNISLGRVHMIDCPACSLGNCRCRHVKSSASVWHCIACTKT